MPANAGRQPPAAPWLEDSQGITAFTVGQAFTSSQRFASFLHHLRAAERNALASSCPTAARQVATTFGIGCLRATAVLNTELRSSFLRRS